jgi:cytochrome c oxidase subunit I+III
MTAAILAGLPLALVLRLPSLLDPLPIGWRAPLAGLTIALTLLPTGLLLAAWGATLRRGRPDGSAALLFALAAAGAMALAALTGAAAALPGLDQTVDGSYVEVAHLHYALLDGAVFPLLAAVQHWFFDATGRRLDELVARAALWLWVGGAALAFLCQHALGLLGMPRRVHTYDTAAGLDRLNLLSTVGAVGMALGTIAFAVNVGWALFAQTTGAWFTSQARD